MLYISDTNNIHFESHIKYQYSYNLIIILGSSKTIPRIARRRFGSTVSILNPFLTRRSLSVIKNKSDHETVSSPVSLPPPVAEQVEPEQPVAAAEPAAPVTEESAAE